MSKSLIAVDIGNSFLHLGRYSLNERDELGFPQLLPWSVSGAPRVVTLTSAQDEVFDQLPAKVEAWVICSVNRHHQEALTSSIQQARPDEPLHMLRYTDFPITVDVEAPERVGVDRLAASFAGYQLRGKSKSLIVIDAGTAITVDRVDEPGIFRGGAILPGPYLMSQSLRRNTFALPLVDAAVTPPCPVGKNTEAAIRSGVFWGTVGAIRELVARIREEMNDSPEVLFTGGAAQEPLASLLNARPVPDLVLRGVALAGIRLCRA